MQSQERLDALWDFADPASSESRLREAAAGPDAAELQTQVARALGLQDRFEEGHAVLDAIEDPTTVAHVRIALERGRLHNSAGDADAARPYFVEAARTASDAGLTFLEVDALHMLAILEPDGDWTVQALAVLDAVTDSRTLRWRVSLHHNAGWAHLDAGRPADARAEFERARNAARHWGTPQQIVWAEEALAELDS